MNRFFALLGVSNSGYYDWCKRTPSKRELANRFLDKHIEAFYDRHHGYYDYHRICHGLLSEDLYSDSRERISRRMRHLRLLGKHKKTIR